MKRITLATLLSLGALNATPGVAAVPKTGAWGVDLARGSGTVEFVATGRPSALKIRGKGDGLKGGIQVAGAQVTGKVVFPLAALDTGIAPRDKHMKEKYLELGTYPDATLEIRKVALSPVPAGDFKAENVAFEGQLTLHGKTRPVSGTASIARAGSQVVVQAKFGMKISDYAIEIPKFAGITVADEVEVNVKTESPVAVASARR